VKDLFDTACLTTTYGSALFADHVPTRTATAVRLLEDAGYANVGKTNLHEFAYGVTSQNPHYGTVPNPVAPGRLAGGSSGGSAAALAADLCDLALGTDSGGSIRIPAAWCGTVGFKPTFGVVPMDGCFPLAPSYDHAGPLARSVRACREAMSILAPKSTSNTVLLESLGDVTVGVSWIELADPLVAERVAAAVGLFPNARRVEFPLPGNLDGVFRREVAEVHEGLYPEYADDYGDNVRAKLESCIRVTEREHEAALRRREEYRERAAEAFEGLDVLVTPTLAFVAPPADVDEANIREATIRFTYPFNALGWPALALPCGTAEDGLPASIQLVGRADDDELVLAVGAVLESSLERGTAA
jgi:Asp-tRNA(Asn)/Glu-tRNA(Gln) amidotransferase A subunit family amidase